VVPISTRRQSPCPHYHIQVHNRKKKDSYTGLHEPSWAKCNLAEEIDVKRLRSTWGHMPDDLLEKIVEAFDRIFDDPTFDDWQ
jgi:uncharacterized protein YifN (PemK superfamily)